MFLDIVTQAMVLLGATVLAFSLLPVRLLYRSGRKTETSWRALFVLILFFILGYIGFALMLAREAATLTDLIVAAVFLGGSGFVLLVVRLSVTSIGQIKQLAAQEKYHAMHDDLTALPNRALFREHIAEAIKKARRENRRVAVFVMDLDRFKEVNDTLGHYYGDLLLQQVAPRLRTAAGTTSVVARLGGDEFGVLCEVENDARLSLCAQRLVQHVERSFRVQEHELNIGISIGIAISPEHGDTSELLLQRADVAMYLAKQRNTGFMIYDSEQDRHSLERLALAGQLRHAIGNDQLTLYYQPQREISSGSVHSVEALVRWNHPERGLLAPGEFLSIAEETGLIKTLTRWVFDAVLRQATAWQRSGADLVVSLNISVKDMQDPQFIQYIVDALATSRMAPGKVVFELVENAAMADVQPALLRLNSLGARFAIDDFGTGYSSLSYLKEMPISEIKIDQSFVLGMLTNDNDAIIVRAIIDLAHNMGYRVVAEGVEDKDTLDLLEILGCDLAQGYYVSPALTQNDLMEWLNRTNLSGQGGGA